MQNKKLSIKLASAIALASSAMVSLTAPSYAQSTVPADLAKRAQDSCVNNARADGYDLKEVVSVEPIADGDVKVVLNLTRNGADARLTCTLNKAGDVVFGDDATAATSDTRTYQPWFHPLWLGLLSLLGLAALLWWLKGRGTEEAQYYPRQDYAVPHGERSEAIVTTNGEPLDIYSGPGTINKVTGNLRNGERVTLSGRQENNWVELADGGWIPMEYLESAARYVR